MSESDEMDVTIGGFHFYVFDSDAPDEVVRPSQELFIRTRAEARFLEHELGNPLFDACGKGVTTSDDESFSGLELDALEQATRIALSVVESQPATWTVFLGYKGDPSGPPIFRPARRDGPIAFFDRAS